MKVRLTGISEESVYEPQAATGAPSVQSPSNSVVMAYFRPVDQRPGAPHTGATIPYEVIQGAQVGDVFTLYLERAAK